MASFINDRKLNETQLSSTKRLIAMHESSIYRFDVRAGFQHFDLRATKEANKGT